MFKRGEQTWHIMSLFECERIGWEAEKSFQQHHNRDPVPVYEKSVERRKLYRPAMRCWLARSAGRRTA